MSINNTPNIGPYTELKPFRFWCQKVLPLVYDESLSYYELLCKVVDYLNKTMEDVDTVITDMGDFQTAYEELITYVNNYFANLDVQNEINNKLDAMAEDGTLTQLMEPLLAEQIAAIPGLVTGWLEENVDPDTGYVIDSSLTIEDAAADAKAVGDQLAVIKSDLIFSDTINGEGVFSVSGYVPGRRTSVSCPDIDYANYTIRVTTKDVFHVFAGDIVVISNIASGFQIGIGSKNGIDTGWISISDVIYITEDDYIYGNARRSDNTELDPEDFSCDFYIINRKIISMNENEVFKYGLINGYGTSAGTDANLINSPFLMPYTYNYPIKINTLKANITIAGTLSISYTKKHISAGDDFDADDYVVVKEITISETGTQIIDLTNDNVIIPANTRIALGMPTDSAVFRYRNGGTDAGFLYVNNTNKYTANANAIGVRFSFEYCKNFCSALKGKKLSILGDSISTFTGYITEGNVSYYPYGDVQAVTDTWWKKMITALEMEIEENNSWSGSRVTTTDGETSAGCMTRCQNLGENPDVIIVYMGINDFINEVALGTYDGTTALPSATTTFREAYAVMLNKILTQYPQSKVYVCTLPQCERDGATGFPEINSAGVSLYAFNKAIKELADAFGVKVLDNNTSGLTYQNMAVYDPNELHPNKYGHSLIANNAIETLDPYVRMRY